MPDWATIAALVAAAAAFIKVFWPAKTQSETVTHSTTEVVDADVLTQFKEVLGRVTSLEKELAATREELAATRKELAAAILKMEEMRKVEEYLQAALHEKEKEIMALRERENELLLKIAAKEAKLDKLTQAQNQGDKNGLE